MRHDWRLVLGIFLTGAMVAAGCGSSSSPTDSGAGGGASGTGGAKGTGGAGGGPVDSGADTKSDTGGAAGADGGTDTHADVSTDQATDTGPGDVAADIATDTSADAVADTGPHDVGPCVTNFGAGNQVLYAFDGGANANWYTFTAHDTNNTGLGTSLGASFTEGHSCAGAIQLAVNFTTYGGTQSGALEHFFGTSPNGANWTGNTALHAWIKLEGADLSEMNGVYFYVKSGNQMLYQSDFAAAANLHDWREVVIDLTRPPNMTAFSGVAINDVQLVGFEALLNTAAAAGASPTPSQIFLLADDIWLEAAPPVDAGGSDAQATDAGGQ